MAAAPERTNVLAVEDDDGQRLLLEQFFEIKPEFDARVVADLDEADVVLASGFEPQIALVDYDLGRGETSVDLCQRIKASHPTCVLFVMSGYVTADVVAKACAAKVDAFLEKPFSFTALDGRLHYVLGEGQRRLFGLTQFPAASTEQVQRVEEVVREQPDSPARWRLLAFSLYLAGRYEEALAAYEMVLGEGDDAFLTAYYAGHACACLGRLDRAVELWERAAGLADTPLMAAKVRGRVASARELLATRGPRR